MKCAPFPGPQTRSASSLCFMLVLVSCSQRIQPKLKRDVAPTIQVVRAGHWGGRKALGADNMILTAHSGTLSGWMHVQKFRMCLTANIGTSGSGSVKRSGVMIWGAL